MWLIYTHLCNMKLYKNGIIKKIICSRLEGGGGGGGGSAAHSGIAKNKSSRKIRGWRGKFSIWNLQKIIPDKQVSG